jgi:hypothetical protein
VIIVSNDGDFDGPVKAARHISRVKSLPELFSEPSGHLDQHVLCLDVRVAGVVLDHLERAGLLERDH